MLICPNCHSENPNRNNFCQKCGVSLTNRDCPECGTSVLLSASSCEQCGAVTGKVLRMVIRESLLAESQLSVSDELPALYEDCIDIGQRYRLLKTEEFPLEVQDWGGEGSRIFVGKVIDCQPLQPSVLKVLLLNQGDFLTKLSALSEIDEIESDSIWKSLDLPKLALPYFKFKNLTPKVPEIYDAWREENSEVILLSDRISWQSLADIFVEESLPLLQLVYWLNEIVALWRSLSPLHYCQSLLITDNIRVDEDQNLGLQLLYPDPVEGTVTLSALGKQWQDWLNDSVQSVPDTLTELLEKLVTGEIQSPDELSLRLDAIAVEAEKSNSTENFPEVNFPHFEELEFSEPSPGTGLQSTLPDTNVEDGLDDSPTAVLAMQLSELVDAAYTDRGRQRPHNEDYFGLSTQVQTKEDNQGKTIHAKGLYVVCDGMGGHAAGEVASQLAVNTLQTYFSQHWTEQFPDAMMITEAIMLANQTIFDINQNNASAGSGRMGTTLIMALVQDTKIAIAHVGDSRIYRVSRRGGLEQLTIDHEVGQQAIQNGLNPDIAYARADAYQLTQALGPHANNFIQPDIRFLEVQEDTLLLLCSDGISDNNLVEENWENYLLPLISSSQSIERGINKLMEFANESNGHDNLTGVLVRLKVRPQIPANNW